MIVKETVIHKKYNAVIVDGQNQAFIWGKFREARERMGMKIKPFEKCFSCDHLFGEEEGVYLCSIETIGNRLMCKECACKFNTVGAGKDGAENGYH